jgi:hypothetical protein
MGSLVLQAPPQPVGWSTAECSEAQPTTPASRERLLAAIAVILWGFLFPLYFTISLLLAT